MLCAQGPASGPRFAWHHTQVNKSLTQGLKKLVYRCVLRFLLMGSIPHPHTHTVYFTLPALPFF